MRSSISSSELRWLVFAAAFLGLFWSGYELKSGIGVVERTDDSEDARLFFVRKLRTGRQEIVVYGDSRTYQGVVPEILTNVLSRSCMNYGFSAGGINHEMMAFLDEHVQRSSSWPGVVVLGLTPLSLSDRARRNEQYHELTSAVAFSKASPTVAGDAGPFSALPFRNLLDKWVACADRDEENIEYSPLGWRGSPLGEDWRKRRDHTLKGYRSRFRTATVTEVSVNELMNWLARWRDRGVSVFLFRVPSCREMIELENEVSGFDEMSLRKRAESAGAIWLELDQCKYECRDGTHLSAAGARAMTTDLARLLQRHLGR